MKAHIRADEEIRRCSMFSSINKSGKNTIHYIQIDGISCVLYVCGPPPFHLSEGGQVLVRTVEVCLGDAVIGLQLGQGGRCAGVLLLEGCVLVRDRGQLTCGGRNVGEYQILCQAVDDVCTVCLRWDKRSVGAACLNVFSSQSKKTHHIGPSHINQWTSGGILCLVVDGVGTVSVPCPPQLHSHTLHLLVLALEALEVVLNCREAHVELVVLRPQQRARALKLRDLNRSKFYLLKPFS